MANDEEGTLEEYSARLGFDDSSIFAGVSLRLLGFPLKPSILHAIVLNSTCDAG